MNIQINNTGYTTSPSVPAKLVYNGSVIRDRNEMVSLTDMWKAAGCPSGKRPDDWKKDSSNRAFLEHVSIISNTPVEGIWKGTRGNNGATFAHWQIGLAYAKYLSPDFHMWCNTVVRERMEGKPARQSEIVTGLDIEVRKAIGGIVKSVMRANLPEMIGAFVEQAVLADPRRAALDVVSVRELLNEAKALQKGRNSLNRKIGYELRTRALLKNPPVPLRRCPHSDVWLYPRDFSMAYMAERGLALVKEHNNRVSGQGMLRLVRKVEHTEVRQ